MKYKEIFKKWHFWLIAISYPTYLFWNDITNPAYYIANPEQLSNPDYLFFIFYFIIRFLIVLIIYSIIWLIFWRGKKDKKDLLT